MSAAIAATKPSRSRRWSLARPDYEPFAHAQLAYDTLGDAARRAGIG